MVATIGLVLGFRSSGNLASAYGVAISTDMVITTVLAFFVAARWGWNVRLAALIAAAFLIVDLAFFGANLLKIAEAAGTRSCSARVRLRSDVDLAARAPAVGRAAADRAAIARRVSREPARRAAAPGPRHGGLHDLGRGAPCRRSSCTICGTTRCCTSRSCCCGSRPKTFRGCRRPSVSRSRAWTAASIGSCCAMASCRPRTSR